jgi:hypothetical protein
MSISRMFRFRRSVVAGLLVPLLLWCVDASAFAQQAAQEKPKATLTGVEIKSEYITIRYEFAAEATGWYDVSIDLLKQEAPSFRVSVHSASGDIGIVKASSGIREVQWEYVKDYPTGPAGDEYYFRINVTRASGGGGSNMWYYIAGGAVVIGGVVAYLLLGKKATEQTELPSAPVRPTQ